MAAGTFFSWTAALAVMECRAIVNIIPRPEMRVQGAKPGAQKIVKKFREWRRQCEIRGIQRDRGFILYRVS
jgi:hypothetical protein